MTMTIQRGKMFIMSGPSGAGKSTLSNRAVEHFQDLKFSISYTTRRPRMGETDGVHYRFVSDDEFKAMAARGDFLENAEVYGKRYGTARKDLEEILNAGNNVLMDIDVQGAESVRKLTKDGVYIFILPPSMGICLERIRKRGDINSETEIEKRLKIAKDEIKKVFDYDYIIINSDVNDAFEKLKSIIIAEGAKKRMLEHKVHSTFGI